MFTSRNRISPCEGDGGVIIQLNNSVYRLTDGAPELLFKADPYILSLVCATADYVVYFSESGKDDMGHYQNSIWRYDLGTKVTSQVFGGDFYLPGNFGVKVYGDYLFMNWMNDLYLSDLKQNQEIIFKDYKLLEISEVQSRLPEGFEVTATSEWDSDGEHHIAKDITKDGKPILFYENAYPGPEKESSLPISNNNRCLKNYSYYDGNYYVIYVEPEHVPYSRVPDVYGTAERVNTDHWSKDYIQIISGPDHSKEEPYYTEYRVRIIGFLPETNEVILYQFSDGSLVVKDLDDNTVTVLDKMKKVRTIQFEWVDTGLYWFYLDDTEEEYGGCHDFSKAGAVGEQNALVTPYAHMAKEKT